MALSESVLNSMNEAQESLRNALAFAARQERPLICKMIANMILEIESAKNCDNLLDSLDNLKDEYSA